MFDLTAFISLATINLLALISPGPDFAIVVKNSLRYSRKNALLTALGVTLGDLIYVTCSVLGLGLIIQENDWVLSILKYLGAGYLLYIGFKNIRAQKTQKTDVYHHFKTEISSLKAIRSGFYTTLLNPKCFLYFISIFSVFMTPETTVPVKILYIILIVGQALLWFSFVAFCLSHERAKEKFNLVGYLIDRITGALFIIFGLKLILFP